MSEWVSACAPSSNHQHRNSNRNQDPIKGSLAASLLSCTSLCVFLCAASLASGVASAETRWYVVGMLHTATYSDGHYRPGDNCPHGSNGRSLDVYRRILKNEYHYSDADADAVLAGKKDKKGDLVTNRGRIDGKPASVYIYPMSAPKTNDYLVEGHHAFGFNLDGKGLTKASAFEDPETHEKGVENQLFRAIGCYAQYDINLPVRPYYEEGVFVTNLPWVPAWLFSVTGDSLDKDGDVTVDFYKAIEHPRLSADNGLLHGATYTIDPNPRSFGHMKGRIVKGVLHSAGDQISLEDEPPFYMQLSLSRPQMRLTLSADGTAAGYIGGFQPWIDWWAVVAEYRENQQGLDLSTLYWNLQALADANPDPRTGKNTAISVTYRIDAVSAYAVAAAPYVPPRQLRPRAERVAQRQ